jgi:hypothetical protein
MWDPPVIEALGESEGKYRGDEGWNSIQYCRRTLYSRRESDFAEMIEAGIP